ncbi:MAG: DEAD/DEAH box helicase family protein, partial [Macromonas sp.]
MIDAWNSGQRWFDVKPDTETITTQTEPQAQQPTQPTIDTSPNAKWRNNWGEAKRTAESLGLPIKDGKRNLKLTEMVPAIEAKLAQQDGAPLDVQATMQGAVSVDKLSREDFDKVAGIFGIGGSGKPQPNTAQDQNAKNYAWIEKETGYAPMRPNGKPYILKTGVGKNEPIATSFGAKPSINDTVRYFATEEDAANWGRENGYAVGGNPYAKNTTQPSTPLARAEAELADWKARRNLPANAGNVADVDKEINRLEQTVAALKQVEGAGKADAAPTQVGGKFAKYQDEAASYGYTIQPDGAIFKGEKNTRVTIKEKAGRLRAEAASGQVLFTGPATPQGLSNFLTSYWYATRQQPATAAKSDSLDLDAMFDEVLAEEVAKDAVGNVQSTSQPDPLDYTPKQYADAWFKWVAQDTGTPLAEVRHYYGSEAGLKDVEQQWVDAVLKAANDGQVLPIKTIDKLLEVRPNARIPEGATPSGYQRPEARKAEKEEAAARKPIQRTAGQAAKSAATNTAAALANAIDGLGALFGGNGKLGSGLSFDEQTYAKAKPLFQAAVANLGDAGKDLKEAMRAVVRMVLDKFGAQTAQNMKPYVVQFVRDMENATTTQPQGEQGNAGTAIYADGAQPLGAVAAQDDARAAGTGSTELRGPDGQQEGGAAGGGADDGRVSKARGRGDRPARADSAAPRAGVGTKQAKRQEKLAREAEQAPELHLDASQQIEAASPINTPALDFVIDDSLELGKGSETVKFRDNLEAIRTLKKIEAENRRASPDEQRILARYVGWGGLKNAFRVAGSKDGEGVAKGWEARVAEVEELLTPAELRAARNSTTAAHYTSETVVKGVWKAVQRLGFRGGSVLEPSMGSGNFLGLMPQAVRGTSRVVGVEYDSLTARMAQQLYPNATVLHSGYQELPMPTNQFALAIGNPPFGKESLYFRSNPAVTGMSIHNQFFVASLDALAPDGIMGMVVSRYLMDAQNNAARLAMAERAEFLGAIRLPDTAFQENARTEVVTDILFFRKRSAGEVELTKVAIDVIKQGGIAKTDVEKAAAQEAQRIAAWTTSEKVANFANSGEDIGVNRYFMRNPGMVVGRMDASGTMQARAGLNVKLDDPSTLPDRLDAAIQLLPELPPKNTVQERTAKSFEVMATSLRLAVRRAEPGGITLTPEGQLKLVVDMDGGEEMGKSVLSEVVLDETTPYNSDYMLTPQGKWQRQTDKVGPDGKPVKVVNKYGKVTNRNEKEVVVFGRTADIPVKDQWGAERIAMVRAMLPIRDLMKNQLMLESTDAPPGMMRVNRKRLNDAYDAFVKAHGPLHGTKSQNVAMTMPDGALALAAERAQYDGKKMVGYTKADILERRVVEPPKPVESVESIADAVAVSLGETGTIDIDRIAKLMGTDAGGAEQLLSEGDSPRAFFDPELQRWESADSYLSGLVRRKLLAARAAGLDGNVRALEKVQPQDWDASQITPNLGSAWIPSAVYADFLRHLGYSKSSVSYSALTNSFTVSTNGKSSPQWAVASSSLEASEIAERTMNSKPVKVTYLDEDKKERVDEEATAEAQMKAREIFNEFQDWAYADTDRREQLVRIFNEKYNTRVTRQRDGSHLKLPGKVPDTVIKMRRHQMNAIWRGITDRSVLYDHVVGAGKTFTAIARIMERRRMGLSRKPMVVVPNHLVEQWANDVLKLYPGANILAAGKADFEKSNRRRLFARIASGDYDMVIMGHSSFGFISLDPSTEERYLDDELRAAVAAVKEAEEVAREEGYSGFRKPFGVAEAERLVKRITERMDKLRDGRRDRLLTFEEMGVDDLTIDESHEFKNLAYSSRLSNVAGMGNKTGSSKATDLHLKIRSLNDRAGTSVAFLTGTPISNSVSEMFLILKNLTPKELKEMGMDNFDAWRTLYASVGTAYEPTESGSLKEVTRLGREWTNMRSLMDLYYSVSDAVTMDDIKAAYAEENSGSKFPIPEVRSAVEGNGDREMVVIKPTPEQRVLLRDVVSGFNGLPFIQDPKDRNKERLRLMDRARKVSLDVRAVDPRAQVEDPTAGKIGAVVNNVARIYRQWDADRGTQIVFLDRSVPSAKGDDKKVKDYDALVQRRTQAINDGNDAEASRIEDELEKFNASEIEELRNAMAGGWNAYAEIKRQLVAQGVPENEIRFVQEANTDDQKMALFGLVKSGKVRVLIGSTPRMGAGTNVQDRLVALHHVDVTWKPSDIEQREGRIVRQGNLFATPTIDGKPNPMYRPGFAVDVMAYATEMTVDAKMWSLNATKLKAINGVRKYDGAFNMEFEDEESASMAEMAALATGNPLMIERVVLDGDIKKLEMAQRSFNRRIGAMRDRLSKAVSAINNNPQAIADSRAFAQEVQYGQDRAMERILERSITVQGKTYRSKQSAQEA